MYDIKLTVGSYTATHAHKPRRIDGASYATNIPLEIPLETAGKMIEEVVSEKLNGGSFDILIDNAQNTYRFTVDIKSDFDVKTLPNTFYYALDEIALLKSMAFEINVQDVQEIIKAKNKTQKSQ